MSRMTLISKVGSDGQLLPLPRKKRKKRRTRKQRERAARLTAHCEARCEAKKQAKLNGARVPRIPASNPTVQARREARRARYSSKPRKPTYAEYLASPLWRQIRKAAFDRHGRVCVFCQNRAAVAIHHSSYAPPVMAGDDLSHLHPTCTECHQWGHGIQDGKIRYGAAKATERMRTIRPISIPADVRLVCGSVAATHSGSLYVAGPRLRREGVRRVAFDDATQ